MYGKKIRMSRLIDPNYGRGVIIPYAHGLLQGPIPGLENINEINKYLDIFRRSRATGIILGPGYLRYSIDYLVGKCVPSLIIVVDWTNMIKTYKGVNPYDEIRTGIYTTVEEAIKNGADAIMSYLTLGFSDPTLEAEEIKKNGMLVNECEKLGLPLIIEPVEARFKDESIFYDKEHLKISARIAAEIGADIVKSHYTGDPETFSEIVDSCAAPIMIAGGPKSGTFNDTIEMIRNAIKAGAVGTVVGRKFFQFGDVESNLAKVCEVVFDEIPVKNGIQIKNLSTGGICRNNPDTNDLVKQIVDKVLAENKDLRKLY